MVFLSRIDTHQSECDMRQVEKSVLQRASTGISGLDEILGGGLPRNCLYLVEGDPGSGKTTFGMQFLLEGVRNGERTLYITLSETKTELDSVAMSHGWDLSDISVLELSALEKHLTSQSQSTLFHPMEVELNQTTKVLLDEVEKVNPERIVFDSLSEMRLMAQSSLRYRRQMLALKQFFTNRNCTVIMLDDRTADAADLQVQSIAHGVLFLHQNVPEYGAERRKLTIVKIRGVKYNGGSHDYAIETGGLIVYPRLVASEHGKQFPRESISSGITQLDALLNGGMGRGTSNLLMGAPGTGKSSIATQFAIAAAKRGEHVFICTFDENIATYIARAESLGMNIQEYIDSGLIDMIQVDPAALSPGEFSEKIRSMVEHKNTRMVVIDSLTGYLNSMPDARFLTLQLHELFTYLSQEGIVTIMILAQHGLIGNMSTQIDLSYLADTVLLLRYFESMGSVRQAISVIKKRNGGHERTIRELSITPSGIQVGKPLKEFQGVLTGVPTFVGQSLAAMSNEVLGDGALVK